MIKSELLKEKYRVQRKLAEECTTVKEYIRRSHISAEEIAKSYGFSLKYIELPDKSSHRVRELPFKNGRI
ncbi:MAG: hypothetical protein GY795_42330 [Desulfobacterales bacterium]|nr:hypothetical protein [Desulfobacterales bacterium]